MTELEPPSDLGFLIASPRSGTTWLQTALNAHPDIACIEQRMFGMYADFIRDSGATRPRLRITLDRYVEALSLHLAPSVEHSQTLSGRSLLLRDISSSLAHRVRTWTGSRVLIDKITPYIGTAGMVVDEIAATFPETRISHLVRDGRDVAVSGVMHWLTKQAEDQVDSPESDRRKRWLVDRQSDCSMSRFFLPGEIDTWARTWREPSVALQHLMDKDGVCLVRYETMLDDPRHEIARLARHHCASCDPDLIEQCVGASTFELMSGGRKRGDDQPGAHVRKGVAGEWRRYFTRSDGEQFQRIAGDTLEMLGYERDPDWWRGLPETLECECR